MTALRLSIVVLCVLLLPAAAFADDYDPALAEKAAAYQGWMETWHTGDLGGVTAGVTFTDASRTEVACLHHQGDSMIWTGMYLGSQALRFMVTGDDDARREVHRIATYLDNAMDMTDTPGYIPRYAGINQHPYNCTVPDGHGWKVLGTGEWEGYYWIDHTSRDQYSGFMWGMSMAHDALATGDPEDEAMREVIADDLSAVIDMLLDNRWHITDQNGEWTGNNAHWVGFLKRLAWLAAVAHVTGNPDYRDMLDKSYENRRVYLPADASSFYNRYDQYYGNNLRHLDFAMLFRWWPDRRRLLDLWSVHLDKNRPWVDRTHNAWFDEVHVAGCRRLGVCDADELAWLREDVIRGHEQYWEPPNHRVAVDPPEAELDSFSVWMNDLLNRYPDLRELINVHPQTAEAREVKDHCWTDMIWQSPFFDVSCGGGTDETFVGGGYDFLVSYWMGVYYGLLPGPGPIADDPLDGDDQGPDSFAGDDGTPGPADDGDDDSAEGAGEDGDSDSGCG